MDRAVRVTVAVNSAPPCLRPIGSESTHSRPRFWFARKAGAPRVASETPELDDLRARRPRGRHTPACAARRRKRAPDCGPRHPIFVHSMHLVSPDNVPAFGEMQGRGTDSLLLQQAELAQAFGGLDDRGLGRAWAPAEAALAWRGRCGSSAAKGIAGRLVCCDVLACGPEVVAEDLCQPQPGDRRAVRQQQVALPGGGRSGHRPDVGVGDVARRPRRSAGVAAPASCPR